MYGHEAPCYMIVYFVFWFEVYLQYHFCLPILEIVDERGGQFVVSVECMFVLAFLCLHFLPRYDVVVIVKRPM